MPRGKGFAGCIKNLTFTSDGKSTLYDLGNPASGDNFTPGCNEGFVAAPVALNLDMSFLIGNAKFSSKFHHQVAIIHFR